MEAVIEALNASSEELLRQALVPLVEGGYVEEFKQGMGILIESVTPSSLTANIVQEIIALCQAMEDYSMKVDFYGALKDYLYTSPNFTNEIELVCGSFIEACQYSERYYELGMYYESLTYDEDEVEEWDVLRHHLSIAECFQRAQFPEKANRHMTQANKHIFRLRTPKDLLERFDSLRAYLAVDKGDYRQGALSFLLLSSYSSGDQLAYLRSAIACTILTEAGPRRQSLFAQIMSDERSKTLPVFGLLERLNQKQLVLAEDLKAFEDELSSEYGFNTTTLHNSVRMHNLHGISQLYKAISVDRLAQIIDISPEEVLRLVNVMIQSKRLKAKIDQPSNMVIYENALTPDQAKDLAIENFCKCVAETARAISQ